MFDSDDEDAVSFPGATLDTYNPPPYSNGRPNQPPPVVRPTMPARSVNQRPPPNRGPRNVPWGGSNEPIILPAPDEDPFINYPGCVKLNGFIITNEIQRNRHRTYSFMVFCQEDHQVYGIPRKLTTPPFGIKLNEEQRWRKKRDLEFGRKIDFIIDQRYDVLEYAKGPSDSIIAENIDGRNCFEVQCVLDNDLKRFYCVEFGPSFMPRPLKFHIENLAYDCQITFDEEQAIQKVSYFEIYKVIKASAIQSIICATPWVNNLPTPTLSDNDIEELKNPDNYKANVTGLRYANDRVLHLRAENQVKIIFCTDFDNLPAIGSIFQFDYVFHPLKKLAVVAAVIKITEHLPRTRIINGQDDESDYMFEITLNISEQKNGFYHDETLGLITDTTKCLRFAPYTTLARPSDEINVRVKACLRQPALFDIVEVCEDSYEYIEACEPPFVQTDAVMINRISGKVFSSQYPNLDLRLDQNLRQKFKIGEFLTGIFYLNDPKNFNDNRYYSTDAERMNTEPLKTLPITEDYALVVMKIRRITYTAPVSKKQMKKNPQAEDVHVFREYNFFLQDYFEATHAGLIGGSKGRVAATDDYSHSILETCQDGGQYTFNYVSQYDTVRYPLDLHQNAMLRNHVNRVQDARQRQSRHSSMSTASLSSRTSSISSSRSSATIPSTGSSSSIPIPPFEDDENDASSRTTTPIAENDRYSERSTQSMHANSIRSERLRSPEALSNSRYSERDGDRYSAQNVYRDERGGSRVSTDDGFEHIDPRISTDYDGFEVVGSRSSPYRTATSPTYPPPPHSTSSSRSNATQPPPRHQYDRSSIDNHSVASNASTASSTSRPLPAAATWGRASAQPVTGNRIESRPDSTNSAPPISSRQLPPTSTWANRASSGAPPPSQSPASANIRTEVPPPRPPPNGSTWASRVSAPPSESYENANIRNDPRSSSSTAVFDVPPRPPPSTSSRASVNSSTSSNRRFESPPLQPSYSPQPTSTRSIPSGAGSTRPPSGTAASIPPSQNGPSRIGSHSSSHSLLTVSNRNSESSPVSDISDRMNNVGIQLRRELFPQLGGPRYRNMCLYRRSENHSAGITSILAQMDLLLTNPPPPVRESIRTRQHGNSLPEFERFAAQFLN